MKIIEKDGREIIIDEKVEEKKREEKLIIKLIKEKFLGAFNDYFDEYYYKEAENKGFSYPFEYLDDMEFLEEFLIFYPGLDFKEFLREKIGPPSRIINPNLINPDKILSYVLRSYIEKGVALDLNYHVKELLKREKIELILNKESGKYGRKSRFYEKLMGKG